MYEISDMGDVRSWRWRGTRRASSPHLLQPFVRKQGRKGRALFVKLTDADGKGTDAKVLSLMVDTWMGGKRPGGIKRKFLASRRRNGSCGKSRVRKDRTPSGF